MTKQEKLKRIIESIENLEVPDSTIMCYCAEFYNSKCNDCVDGIAYEDIGDKLIPIVCDCVLEER